MFQLWPLYYTLCPFGHIATIVSFLYTFLFLALQDAVVSLCCVSKKKLKNCIRNKIWAQRVQSAFFFRVAFYLYGVNYFLLDIVGEMTLDSVPKWRRTWGICLLNFCVCTSFVFSWYSIIISGYSWGSLFPFPSWKELGSMSLS